MTRPGERNSLLKSNVVPCVDFLDCRGSLSDPAAVFRYPN